jgi:hypothetical protein
MTCAEFNERFAAWLGGILTDADARAVEQHAAECDACGGRLDAASPVGELSRALAPPSSLREITLRAVAQRRAIARWRRVVVGVAGIAAIAALVLVSRQAQMSTSDIQGPPIELLAVSHARPELAALDAAERDVEKALREQPADSTLAGELVRIRRQRDAMQRLVAQVDQ